jgi:hypothetical protein
MRDTIALEVDPAAGVLERLGVTHVLVREGGERVTARFADYEPAARAGPWRAYALPLRSAALAGARPPRSAPPGEDRLRR